MRRQRRRPRNWGLVACLSAAAMLPALAQTTLPMTPADWKALTRDRADAVAVVFSASYCATCPLALKALQEHRSRGAYRFRIFTVVMDAEASMHPTGRHAGVEKDGDLLMHPTPSSQALRYAVRPSWRGETPYVVLLAGGSRRDLLGVPAAQDLAWLTAP